MQGQNKKVEAEGRVTRSCDYHHVDHVPESIWCLAKPRNTYTTQTRIEQRAKQLRHKGNTHLFESGLRHGVIVDAQLVSVAFDLAEQTREMHVRFGDRQTKLAAEILQDLDVLALS